MIVTAGEIQKRQQKPLVRIKHRLLALPRTQSLHSMESTRRATMEPTICLYSVKLLMPAFKLTFGKFTPLNTFCHLPSLASTKTFALKLAEIPAILFYGYHRLLWAIIMCYYLLQLSLKNTHNIIFSSTSHDDLILLRHISEVIS